MFWEGVSKTEKYLLESFDGYMKTCGNDRKQFAVEIVPEIEPLFRPIYFQMFNNKNVKQMIINIISKNTGSSTTIDSVRPLWNNYHWNECAA